MASVGVVDVYNVFEVDSTKPWQILSHYFPDKVGGKPAWLSLKPLPSQDELKCGRCGKPCSFLLQKYAPKETTHRMIFIFLCRDPACCRQNASDNFVVLRSQLPLTNDFYPETPPDEEYFDMSSDYPKACSYTRLCVVCGCAGPKLCGKCHRMSYCSKEHQTSHWKAGHRSACGHTSLELNEISVPGVLFEEFVLDIRDDLQDYASCGESGAVMERLFNNGNVSELVDSEKFSAASAASAKPDKHFNLFKEATSTNSCQVLRYDRGGRPLWVTDHNILHDSTTVPCCERCGAPRHFEFQVMPQLLNYLNLDNTGDSIDWATLLVYTCSADCQLGGQYSREFLWKQDFVSEH